MVIAKSGIYHFAPTGWRTPIKDDYLKINKILKDNDVPISTAVAFEPDQMGGLLGFHHIYVGIRRIEAPGFAFNVDTACYVIVKEDGTTDGLIAFGRDDESFGLHYWDWAGSYYPVRLVQDIK